MEAPLSVEAAAASFLEAAVTFVPAWLHRVLAGEADARVTAVAGEALGELRTLLAADIDEQRTTPLAALRAAVAPSAGTGTGTGADAQALAPASWSDVDPALVPLALAWGAAKAAEHKRRHGGPSASPRQTAAPAPTGEPPGAVAAPGPVAVPRSRTVARPGSAPATGGSADDPLDKLRDGVVVAWVPDLMDRSRVASRAPRTRFVTSPAELAGGVAEARVVVVDLARPGAIEAVAAVRAARPAVPIVAFGPHVDAGVLAAAEAAGATAVPRSRFFARLGELRG